MTVEVISTNSIVSNTGGTGVGTLGINYWTNGNGNWTDERGLGEALGYQQVVLDLTYNQQIDAIMKQLTTALGRGFDATTGAYDGGLTPASVKFGSQTFAEANRTIDQIGGGELTASRGDDVMVRRAGFLDQSKQVSVVGTGLAGYFNAYSLVSAINHNESSQFWAMLDQADDSKLYIFNKDGGDNNGVMACDVYDVDRISQAMAQDFVDFENVATGITQKGGTTMSLGTTAADVWAKMKPVQTKEVGGNQVWNVTSNGRDVGDDLDFWIAAARDLRLPGIGDGSDNIINGLDRYSFVELQDAANGNWAGAELRTQSNAQAALEALDYSITVKDKIRADLGALQNRLQNTMTALEIQTENLQASESRISDVDVAAEMTEFTKNNILVQAAVGMLAQANGLGQLALALMR
jgi:flagellin-like hook-associated protein FlgL